MKNISFYIWKLSVFYGEIFNVFEWACFRNGMLYLVSEKYIDYKQIDRKAGFYAYAMLFAVVLLVFVRKTSRK